MFRRTWKKIQAIKVPAPRMLVPMAPSARGDYGKAARGATSGRNKKEYLKERTSASMLRGRQKIMMFLDRGIRLTSA